MTKLKNIYTIKYGLFFNENMAALSRQNLDSQIKMRIHKRMHKVLHHINIIEHTIVHIGELIVIMAIGWGSILFANYNTSYELYHREGTTEANIYLQMAEKAGKPSAEKLISTRTIDSSVDNTFSAWYCTYGAARISPEFFPYTEDKTSQQRTWGGNAIDRCENAKEAGFKIWSSVQKWALVIYNPGNWISSLWHVGKVVFYNSKTKYIIIRDMNRVAKNIMSDHWENLETANIKCFIYPKPENTVEIQNETIETGSVSNNSSVNTWILSTTPEIEDNKIEETSWKDNQTTPTENEESNTDNKDTGNHFSGNQEPEKETNTETSVEENKYTIQEIPLNTENISDIAKHFMNQYDFSIIKTSPSTIKLWDTITLTIKAKEKMTNTLYEGILPFSVNILTSNNKLLANISRIQMFQGKDIIIEIKTVEKGNSSIVIMLDDANIGKVSINTN